jgi:hypothetical protein
VTYQELVIGAPLPRHRLLNVAEVYWVVIGREYRTAAVKSGVFGRLLCCLMVSVVEPHSFLSPRSINGTHLAVNCFFAFVLITAGALRRGPQLLLLRAGKTDALVLVLVLLMLLV